MKTTAALRPFTRDDYDLFAGVETAAPRVAYGDRYIVLTDGPTVEFHLEKSNGDVRIYGATYPNAATAARVAAALLAAPRKRVARALLDRLA